MFDLEPTGLDSFDLIDDVDEELEEKHIPANECIRRLNAELTTQQKRNIVRKGIINPSVFSKYVLSDKIPYHYIEGSLRKMYLWHEVSAAFGVLTMRQKQNIVRTKVKTGDETITIKHGNEEVEVSKDIFQEYQDRLDDELADCITPTERMNVTDKFWGSMFKEFKLRVQMGAYIEIAKVSEVLDGALPALRDNLFKISPTIAQKYPHIEKDVIQDIHEAVNTALAGVQQQLTDNPNTQTEEFLNDEAR